MKKTIALILAIVMLLGILPGTAFAESPAPRQSENPFTDVDDSQYFYDPVMWAVENGITNGMTPTTFAPFVTCNRAQIVTFLWRAAGSPVPESSEIPFADVPAGTWYTDAVLWAAENEITLGTSADTFSPEAPCTRAHAVTFLWRTYGSQEPDSGNSGFKDIRSTAYYHNAVLWAEENGITTGVTEDTFEPDTACARAQIVTFLYRAANLGGSYTVTFVSNGAVVATQTVAPGSVAAVPEEPVREGYTFLAWYENGNEVDWNKLYQFNQPLTGDLVLYAKWIDNSDTDGEGLCDGLEEYYKTDPQNPDTDGDGINDYIEVMTGLNPLIADSDGNGIDDSQEDADGDGLSNGDEAKYGTDITFDDSDTDGLNDAEEIITYLTDPTNEDTDGDGASDGAEVRYGTDPLSAEGSFDITLREDSEDTVTPIVDITLSGEQVDTLTVESVDDDYLFPEEMPGYLGHAYDFNVEGTFGSATLSFEFDETNLGDSDFDPVIYYYNEETGLLEELPTVVNGNVASTTVSHFSTYILLNRIIFQRAFTWVDTWDSEQQFTDVELVLVIDDSGSMGSQGANNDPQNLRLSVSQTLINELPENSKIGIVKFGEETTFLTEKLTTDKEAAATLLTTDYFRSKDVETNMYEAVVQSFDLFESVESTTLKIMVVLTDGAYSGSYLHSSVVSAATEKNVQVYTVGLGTAESYFNNCLKPISDETGGRFYYASDASQLAEIYENISERIDLEADSDEDDIPDYYEDNMVLFNGVKIQLDKYNCDTDGDGLLDGEEVIIRPITNAEEPTKVYVMGSVVSNPNEADSDYDGYPDKDDEHKMRWDVSDRDLVMCASMSYSSLPIGALSDIDPDLCSEINGRFIGIDGTSAGDISELRGWKVIDKKSTLRGLQIFAFEKDNCIVVACRGTEPKGYDWHEFHVDWANNGLTWLLGLSTQTPTAKKFMKQLMKENPNKEFYVTGHSLGGHLAYNVGAKGISYKQDAIKGIVTFNGLGLYKGNNHWGDDWDAEQLLKKQAVIRDYMVYGDPVSRGFLGYTTLHYGDMIPYIKHPQADSEHSLFNFIVNIAPEGRFS